MYSPYQEAVRAALGYDPAPATADAPLSLLEQLLAREAAANNAAPGAPQAPSAGGTIANNADLETLRNTLGIETGTPAGEPAAPASALDAPRGASAFGSFAGSLAGGPIGGRVGGIAASAAANALAASRAQEIADEMGLGAMTSPGRAAGMAVGRGLASNVPGALGVPFGGLLGQIASGFMPGYNARSELQEALDRSLAAQFADLEPDEMSAAVTRMQQQMLLDRMDLAPRSVDFGIDQEHALGINPSFAASDYYDSGLAGMDPGAAASGAAEGNPGQNDNTSAGYAARGGLATADGFRGPDKYAGGGLIELAEGGKLAIGPGGGLDDLIPTSIDGRRAAALSDGEFVVPADVVSMMGDGSSNAGARRLYDMVRQIRQAKTGTARQAGPLPVGKILERTAS